MESQKSKGFVWTGWIKPVNQVNVGGYHVITPTMSYTIEFKEDSYGQLIYTAVAPKGIRLKYPIGYFPTEQEAIEAYNKASNT